MGVSPRPHDEQEDRYYIMINSVAEPNTLTEAPQVDNQDQQGQQNIIHISEKNIVTCQCLNAAIMFKE